MVHIVGEGGATFHDAVVDVDGVYLPFLDAADAVAVLVRPDFYVLGAARSPGGVADLVDACAQLAAEVVR